MIRKLPVPISADPHFTPGPDSLLTVADNVYGLRGHQLRLYEQQCRLNLRKNFFTQRVVNHWNRLSSYVGEAPSVNAFTHRVNDFLQYMDD